MQRARWNHRAKKLASGGKKVEIVDPCFHCGSEKKRDETEQIGQKFRGGKAKIKDTEKRSEVNERKEGN